MVELYTGEGNEPIKVACRSCIDGHRSPTCIHFERILVQVRPPGRPRVHCAHGHTHTPGDGKCAQCGPSIAYIIPNGNEHRKRGSCGKDEEKKLIHDWEETTADVAKKHEEDRARELEEKRAARAQLKGSNKSKKRSLSQSASAEATARAGPCCSSKAPLHVGPASAAHEHKYDPNQSTTALGQQSVPQPQVALPGDFSCGPTLSPYMEADKSENENGKSARRQLTAFMPGQSTALQPLLGASDCTCGDDCHCIGCVEHPNNKETQKYVADAYKAEQLNQREFLNSANGGQGPSELTGAFKDNNDVFAEFMNNIDYSRNSTFQAYTHGPPQPACTGCDCGPGCSCFNCPCHSQPAEDSPARLGSLSSGTATPVSSQIAHQQTHFQHGDGHQSLDYMHQLDSNNNLNMPAGNMADSHLLPVQHFAQEPEQIDPQNFSGDLLAQYSMPVSGIEQSVPPMPMSAYTTVGSFPMPFHATTSMPMSMFQGQASDWPTTMGAFQSAGCESPRPELHRGVSDPQPPNLRQQVLRGHSFGSSAYASGALSSHGPPAPFSEQ